MFSAQNWTELLLLIIVVTVAQVGPLCCGWFFHAARRRRRQGQGCSEFKGVPCKVPCRGRELMAGKRHLGSLALLVQVKGEDAWCLGPCPWGALAVGIKEQLSPTLRSPGCCVASLRAWLLCTPVLLFLSSHIYCTGELLWQVQRARLFQDDKDFVDMPLKSSPDVVLKHFEELVNATPGGALSKLQLAQFVESNFYPPGKELKSWMPPDWSDSIPLLQRISDEKLRSWAQVLNAKWKQLGRRVDPDVQASPWRYSLIYVPNPVIVPGGRFREYYYWDSFWILEGLLLSNMAATAKGLIQNFLYLVSK
ncbi:hypothetical protein E2320_007255 [Naja naja]|nr:hypothetical protein E2320_007255 [Naja naja]